MGQKHGSQAGSSPVPEDSFNRRTPYRKSGKKMKKDEIQLGEQTIHHMEAALPMPSSEEEVNEKFLKVAVS